MMPKPKLFVLKQRLHKQRPQPPKTILSLCHEDGFCSSETDHDKRIIKEHNYLFW